MIERQTLLRALRKYRAESDTGIYSYVEMLRDGPRECGIEREALVRHLVGIKMWEWVRMSLRGCGWPQWSLGGLEEVARIAEAVEAREKRDIKPVNVRLVGIIYLYEVRP